MARPTPRRCSGQPRFAPCRGRRHALQDWTVGGWGQSPAASDRMPCLGPSVAQSLNPLQSPPVSCVPIGTLTGGLGGPPVATVQYPQLLLGRSSKLLVHCCITDFGATPPKKSNHHQRCKCGGRAPGVTNNSTNNQQRPTPDWRLVTPDFNNEMNEPRPRKAQTARKRRGALLA
jgi:hypothetical protein